MRQQIKGWLRSPILWLYESAAIIALVSRQYAISVLCGIIIPAIAMVFDCLKEKFSKDK